MTKFIHYYNLCPIPDPKEFLGISPDSDDGNILTTVGKNIAMVIKLSTQKQLRSWSVLEKLSSKIVYNRRNQQYVGVFANRALRCWDESVSDVNKCKKLKFQKSIAELITSGEDTYILYNDGTCQELEAAKESRKHELDTSTQQLDLAISHTLTDACITLLANGNRLLTYFKRNNSTGELHLVKVNIESGDTVNFNLKRQNLNVRLVGFAVVSSDDAPMLLTIWSDKRIFLLSLIDSVGPEKSPGSYVSMISALNVDNPISVLGVSRHVVAIYGANSCQEGASLLLYNTQFKVIKAKQHFKVYFNFSRLWTVNEHILLAMGPNLSIVSYRMSKELLSDLVGTQTNNEFETPVEGDHINEEEYLEECLQFSNEQSTDVMEFSPDNISPVKFIQADGKTVPFESVHAFDRELDMLNQAQLYVELVEVEHAFDDIEVSLMTNLKDNGFVCREVGLLSHQMERCGASEHEITEKLLTVLIKADQLHDVATCLRRYTNISEKILTETLHYLLNKLEPESITVINGNIDEPSDSESILDNDQLKPADVLNILLSCSFETKAIAVHIRRRISYAKVLFLLKYLYNLLVTSDEENEVRVFSTQHHIEFELQILRWFGVIMNTHFQKLAMSKDVKLGELLYGWLEIFVRYEEEFVELEQVAALLYNIVDCKKILKEVNYSKWYSIEEIVLY